MGQAIRGIIMVQKKVVISEGAYCEICKEWFPVKIKDLGDKIEVDNKHPHNLTVYYTTNDKKFSETINRTWEKKVN